MLFSTVYFLLIFLNYSSAIPLVEVSKYEEACTTLEKYLARLLRYNSLVAFFNRGETLMKS